MGLGMILGCDPIYVIDPNATASDGLVFVRPNEGYGDLWRARLSDGAERILLRSGTTDERWPFWSQRARKVLYEARPNGAKRTRLFLIDPRLRQASALSQEKEHREHWAVWSPDGSRVAYAFSDRHTPAGGQDIAEVLVGTSKRRVASPANSSARFLRPEYHPTDGSILAHQIVGGYPNSLWIFAVDEPPRRVSLPTATKINKARFSSDGQAILFSSQPQGSRTRDLEIVDLDGTHRRLLAGDPDLDEHSGRQSPIRREVAFISNRDGNQDLFIVPLDGGPARNVSQTPDRDEAAPRWSPDGEKIATTHKAHDPASAGGRPVFTHIAVFDRGSGETLFESEGTMPDWMPPW